MTNLYTTKVQDSSKPRFCKAILARSADRSRGDSPAPFSAPFGKNSNSVWKAPPRESSILTLRAGAATASHLIGALPTTSLARHPFALMLGARVGGLSVAEPVLELAA